jgi:hypothetical protein
MTGRYDLPEPDPDFPDPGRVEQSDWSGVVFVLGIGLAVLVLLLSGRL